MVQNSEQKQDQSNSQNERSIGIPGSGLSRMGQQSSAPRMPGAYPGYGAYNPSQQAASGTQDDSGRRLIVGRGISMSGEIEACDHLVVEGKVEAALKGAKLLEISDSGTFFGTVEIDEATVAGSFEGDLTVKGRLTIKAGGSITGAISYGELAVEAGAVLDGKLSPLKTTDGSTKSAPKAARKEEPQQNTEAQDQRVQQSEQGGGELPFSEQKSVAAE